MENLTKAKGDEVEMRCTYTGDGVIKAKWVHLGEEFAANDVEDDTGTQTNGDVRNFYTSLFQKKKKKKNESAENIFITFRNTVITIMRIGKETLRKDLSKTSKQEKNLIM